MQRLRKCGHVSGEDIGKDAGISRTAIWKHINELRRDGYQIESSPNRGYRLISTPDNPFPEEIKAGLNTHILGQSVEFHHEVTSTQDIAKSVATKGASEGTVIIAETQTHGRGRIRRTWTSLPGGIYFSIILRPEIKPTEALQLPLIAGVAAAQAIRTVTNLRPSLKWPNDITLDGKKVGGILTEMSAEIDRLDWVIIGIGLNANIPKSRFPDDVAGIAASIGEIYGDHVSRVKLIQAILTRLEILYEAYQFSGFEDIRQEWKRLSNTIGAQVTINSTSNKISGLAIDIDQDGALILQKEDGAQERIIAGDVSLRNTTHD